jgi:hypothetical protein
MQGTGWFNNTPNLAYVAISRHSKTWISYFHDDSQELQMFRPLESCDIIDGIKRTFDPRALDVLDEYKSCNKHWLLSGNHENVGRNEKTLNKMSTDFVPEVLEKPDCITVSEVQDFIFKKTQLGSAMKDNLPQFLRCGQGARAYQMHPKIVIKDTARTRLLNASGLAVHQLSSNHWDDQRNVDLRLFQKNHELVWTDVTVCESQWLFRRFIKSYFSEEHVLKIHEPNTTNWLETRSKQFISMLDKPQIFGESGRSMNHKAFLKTQDKVKPKENFSAQLQYGQTVIASDPSYNGLIGPFAQKIERNLQRALRDDYLIDVGYSDRDLAQILRDKNLFEVWNQSPVQIDVTRQDSSHSAVVVLTFCLLLEYLGLPKWLTDIYLLKRSRYKVNSMAACLYAGLLTFVLPSGDPFTLLANICQMMLVDCERFDIHDCAGMTKGDDTILERLPKMRLGPQIDALRNVQLEVLENGVAYHAGRFLLPNQNMCYDPVRFVMKMLAKGEGKATNEELDIALHDRLMWFDGVTLRYLQHAIGLQYPHLRTDEVSTILRIANSLKNGNLYWKLVEKDVTIQRKVRFSAETNCAVELVLWLGHGETIAQLFEFNNGWQTYLLFKKHFKNENVFYGKEIPRRAWLNGGIAITERHVVYIR